MLLLCLCIAAFLFAAGSHAHLAESAKSQHYATFQLSDSSEFLDAFSLLPKQSYSSFIPPATGSPAPPGTDAATHSKTIAKTFGYEVQSIEKQPV